MDTENRRTPRSRVFLHGELRDTDTGVTIECRVLNLSTAGALLAVSAAVAVPVHFNINIRGTNYPSEVRWRRSEHVGIRFFVEDSEEAKATAFDLARELYVARAENKRLRKKQELLLARLAELRYVEHEKLRSSTRSDGLIAASRRLPVFTEHSASNLSDF